mmetsp:Transcript_44036/g.143224  ORF Transcript_44036/g.143224 Transcript_44036/m.143224 type:complete len:219 (+) Transcript_44036:35-691(+)
MRRERSRTRTPPLRCLLCLCHWARGHGTGSLAHTHTGTLTQVHKEKRLFLLGHSREHVLHRRQQGPVAVTRVPRVFRSGLGLLWLLRNRQSRLLVHNEDPFTRDAGRLVGAEVCWPVSKRSVKGAGVKHASHLRGARRAWIGRDAREGPARACSRMSILKRCAVWSNSRMSASAIRLGEVITGPSGSESTVSPPARCCRKPEMYCLVRSARPMLRLDK